jgi:diacylglycerol kinase (ATP)
VPTRACLIVNPAAGRGRGARILPRVRAAFAQCGITDVRLTASAGDEGRLVQNALGDGCDTIAVLGGDGTWSKAASAVARSGAAARVAFLCAGTGNDFVKNLSAPAGNPVAMARLAAGDGIERRIDMARVDDYWFLNVAGFAFDVAVIERAQRMTWASGSTLYALAALRELTAYPGLDVRVNSASNSTRHLLLALANGTHFGGAFHIAPGALVDDGMLDAIAIVDAPPLARIGLLARAACGTHLSHPLVSATRAPRFTLTFAVPPLFEADGELRRAASSTVVVESCPAALSALVSPADPHHLS